MKIALSHDWLNGMRGGEKCLEVLCELYPESPIYTLFYEKNKVSDLIASHPIHTSVIQRFPGVFKYYRYYLPFFTSAMDRFRTDADLIVSSSHCVAKGIRKRRGCVHINYCFTPVRYAWGFFDEYFGDRGPLARRLIGAVIERLRRWDLARNADIDRFVAISEHVRERIRRHYRREADVIYPPVDTRFFTPGAGTADHYLVVSALVPYKRVDLAIKACQKLGRKLVVIGDGPERKKLEAMAGPLVSFLGWQPDTVLREHYRAAKALLFPGEEDFGIVPVEAQACGRFVIAYRRGGALETVREGRTGIFFDELSDASLADAIERFERTELSASEARANAETFSRERFAREIGDYVARWTARREPALR